jgi:succinate dehydrogenase / fumarate reductase membrane anchor subunit
MKHDVKFWWLQSLTAFSLIPVFLFLLVYLFIDFNNFNTIEFISSHIFSLSIFFLMSLYHGTLGIQVILEDYISCITLRNICITTLYAFSILTTLALFFIVIAILI